MKSFRRPGASDTSHGSSTQSAPTTAGPGSAGNAAMAESLKSGPFAPELNAALSESFGENLASLDLEMGADAASESMGAAAFTVGSSIGLSSSVSQDPSDRQSMEIIGHEVAHALAGGGSGETVIDGPGDAGEAAADKAGKDFANYMSGGMQGPAPKLSAAAGGRAAIHRWSFQDPTQVKDPGHEILTLMALRKAKAHGGGGGALLGKVDEKSLPSMDSQYSTFALASDAYNSNKVEEGAQEFVRGSVYNDDPRGFLFGDEVGTEHAGNVLEWASDFSEKKAGDASSLTSRSHYGDMQFLHGMATKEGEAPEETKAMIMNWSALTVKVAKGEIPGDTPLSQVPEVAHLFQEAQSDWTVKDLFAGGKGQHDEFTDELLRQRAAGSLMHLIEDTYCDSHTGRDEDGEIEQFRAYASQDGKKHGEADSIADGKNIEERLKNTPGAMEAVDKSAKLLRMIDAGEDTAEILEYLDDDVFALSEDAVAGGAGEKYAKDAPADKGNLLAGLGKKLPDFGLRKRFSGDG